MCTHCSSLFVTNDQLFKNSIFLVDSSFSRKKGGKKKEIITLNCISKQQYLHARILSRPYGANDNLFCLDSAAIASPHCREKHCLGATPTSHDTRRLCFVVP